MTGMTPQNRAVAVFITTTTPTVIVTVGYTAFLVQYYTCNWTVRKAIGEIASGDHTNQRHDCCYWVGHPRTVEEASGVAVSVHRNGSW